MNKRLIRILGGTTEHYPYALENKYPRLLEQIMTLWDSDEIDGFFMALMLDERGNRVGFPPDVAAEIMHLSLVHASQESPDKNKGIWDVSADLFVNFTPQPAPENGGAEPFENIQSELKKLNFPCTPEGFFDAVEEGNRAAVAFFIEVPISTEIRDSRGWTPLMLAVFLGNDEIAGLLIQYKAYVNAVDLGGNSALHWAAFSGRTACIKLLIQHHAKTEARNNLGWTPLIQATARNHLEGIALLIDSGVNLDAATDDGYTALHKAAASGYLEIVELLLEQGASKDLKTREGLTPLQLAVKHEQKNVIKALS